MWFSLINCVGCFVLGAKLTRKHSASICRGLFFFPKNVICTFLCTDALICHIKALLLSYSKLLSFPCLEKSCIQGM